MLDLVAVAKSSSPQSFLHPFFSAGWSPFLLPSYPATCILDLTSSMVFSSYNFSRSLNVFLDDIIDKFVMGLVHNMTHIRGELTAHKPDTISS